MITFLKFFLLDSKWAHLVQLDIAFFIRKKEVVVLATYACDLLQDGVTCTFRIPGA